VAGEALPANTLLATVFDPDFGATLGQYPVRVDWGDGTSEPVGLVPHPEAERPWRVLTTHTYAEPGAYRVTVVVTGEQGGKVLTTLPATVSEPPPPLWSFTARQRTNDPERAELIPVGAALVAPNTGGLRLSQALDFDRSPGTSVGRDPALVYNSDTASPRPIIEGLLTTAVGELFPTTVDLRRTWDDVPPGWTTFTTAGSAAGDTLLLAAQVEQPEWFTGRVEWELEAVLHFPDETTASLTALGTAMVVSRNDSPFGAGWGLGGYSQLVIQLDGALIVQGSGDARWFAGHADGTFDSPAEDFGTLLRCNCCGGGYVSTTRTRRGALQQRRPLDLHHEATRSGMDVRPHRGAADVVSVPDGSVTTLVYLGAVVHRGAGRSGGAGRCRLVQRRGGQHHGRRG
jgi:hypothetical protein